MLTLLIFNVFPTVVSLKAHAADTTPPVTTFTQTPDTPDGKNDWYVSPVNFSLATSDLGSGVREINYKVSDGPWNKIIFTGGLNLAPNPSFEVGGITSTGADKWQSTTNETGTVYSRTEQDYAPGYDEHSIKITAQELGWHAINHRGYFAVTSSLSNMSAAVSLKTENVEGEVYFKIYAISQVGTEQVYTEVAQSASLNGTNDWTRVYLNYVVFPEDVIGVYADIGLEGTGNIWIDAVSIANSTTSATANFTVSNDKILHEVVFYSIDFAGNTEAYDCSVTPKINCVTFKMDLTPPGNWRNSGAYRSLGSPSNHHLYTFATVEDLISGLSSLTNKFQYQTDNNPTTFGIYEDLGRCSSTWLVDQWSDLESVTPVDGILTYELLTKRTDFCNDDWKTCKTVRFYAEDMAGNFTTKDLCINGPWIKVRGKGIVRSSNNIDMISESREPNTDGLIEAGGSSINFFSSSEDWKVTFSPIPRTSNYDTYVNLANPPVTISGTLMPSTTGTYLINSNYELTKQKLPNGFSTALFDQIIFVNGDLTVSDDITIRNTSTLTFIVKGSANIDKSVQNISAAILADEEIRTAYNVGDAEASKTLYLKGLFSAHKFLFQRTLQGTNNNDTPSEDFLFEAKYPIQLKPFFAKTSVKWLSVE